MESLDVTVAPYLPEESGIAAYTLELAEALNHAGHTVSLIGSEVQAGASVSSVINLGRSTLSFQYPFGPIFKAYIIRQLLRKMIHKSVDIVHYTSPPYVIPRNASNFRTVCSVFNYQTIVNIWRDVPSTESGVMRFIAPVGWSQFYFLDRRGIRDADGLVLTTTAAAAKVSELSSGHSEKLIAYIPPCARPPVRPSAVDYAKGQVRLLFAERDITRPRNNLETVLGGLLLLPNRLKPTIKIDIVGNEGSRRLRELLSRVQKEDVSVTLHGRLPPMEYAKLLVECHVYISLRDIWEQASFGVIQALSAGLCAIVSRRPSYADIIRDQVNGFKIDPHSPEELAKVLMRIADDRALLADLACRSREYWSKKFSPTRVAAQLAEFYLRLLDGR